MPSYAEVGMPGYSWWDLYNVSDFVHSLGYDVFILSMPLKGINLGPGSTPNSVNTQHWFVAVSYTHLTLPTIYSV